MKLFIAGTDTEVGKTYIAAGLLAAFNQAGYSTLGIKPVASGCKRIDDKNISADTLLHLENSSVKLSHDEVAPFAFEPAIAPHVAAELSGASLSVSDINEKLHTAFHTYADVTIIEGCGGWYVPLNNMETMADFVLSHSFKVILVVGMRLGCINHTLLTYRAMQQEGANVVGWIANCVDPEMKNCDDSIRTLQEWLPVPCLGVIKHGEKVGRDVVEKIKK